MGNLANQFLIGEMEAAVRRQTDEGKSFTALDISRLVQATGVRERHRNLKAAVHEMYERGAMAGYARTLITLPAGEQPFLYHPAPPGSKIHRFATARNSVRASGPIRALDCWNRLRIPARALRDAGALPGDTVYVSVDAGGNVALTLQSQTNFSRAYRVDRYNNVRLTVGTPVAPSFTVAVTKTGMVQATPLKAAS